MGGFAALLGGLGAGAQQYGQQLRGLLEQRREHMMGLLMNQATIERNPEHRANILRAVSDMAAGKKPMDQILPPLFNSWQKSAQQDLQVAQAAGYGQQPQPGLSPGQSLGQVGGLVQKDTAAAPSTSPVAPQGTVQAGPLPAAQGAPSISDTGIAPLVAPSQAAPLQAVAPTAQADQLPFFTPAMGMAGPDPMQQYLERTQTLLQNPNITPAMAGDLQAGLGQQAEMARQLGLSNQYVQQKVRFLNDVYRPQLQQMYQNAAPFMRTLIQAHGMDMGAWAFNPDINARQPNFPAAAGLMRSFQPKVETINARDIDPATRERLGIPEHSFGNVKVQRDPWGYGPEALIDNSYLGDAPANAQITLARDAYGNYLPVSVSPNMPTSPPIPMAGGDNLSVVAPGMGRFGTQTDINTGRTFYTNPDIVMRQAATQRGLLNPGGVMTPQPLWTGGGNVAFAPVSRATSTQQTEAGTSSETVTRRGGAIQPPVRATGGAPTSLGAGGMGPDVAAFMANPDTKSQVMGTVAAYMNPRLSEAEAKSVLTGATGGKEGTVFARALREQIRQQTADDPTRAIKWDAPVAAMAQRSQQTLDEIDRIKALITKMQNNGELGLVMTRWNAFWTNRLGYDLSQNQDYVALANALGLLNTAMGFVHGGARGGGSIQMRNAFAEHLNVNKMNAPTLLGAIDEERKWLESYANPSLSALGATGLRTARPGQQITPAGPGVNDRDYQDLMDMITKGKPK